MAASFGIANLRLTQADGSDKMFNISDGQTLRVGRAETNDIVLDAPGISRMHAAFSASSSGLIVSDLSSLNGTFVNGRRIATPVDLSSHDIVDIGPFKITVQISDPAAEVTNGQRARTMTLALRPVSLTILVVNVKGYSRFAQSLPVEDVESMLTQWLETVTKVIEDHSGKIDKRIDDRVIALWSGMDGPALAEQAVRAGLEINRQTWEMCRTGKWLHDQTHPWDCKVAVHAAQGLMGAMRGEQNFGVLGDGMNTAFRISDGASKSNHDIMLSGEAYEAVKSVFKAKEVKLAENDEGEIKIQTFAVDPLSPGA